MIITKNKDDIKAHLEFQDDRGLDSVGIVNKKDIYRAVKKDIEGYNSYIDTIEDIGESIHLIHHRKATVGGINLDNCHPFIGKKFILIQNGTVKGFHKETNFDKDVDSHNLLMYIEKHTKNIKNIPKVIKKFKEEFKEEFGIIVLADYKGNIIFISDGGRESYIEIEDNNIKLIRNYKPSTKEGYKNIGYIIFDFEGNIIKKEFKKELNSEDFKKKVIYQKSFYRNTRYDGRIVGAGNWKKEEKKGKEKGVDIELEIEYYLWDNSDVISLYTVDVLIEDFLYTEYGLEDTFQYYNIYKKYFPTIFFANKMQEVIDMQESLIYKQ